MGEKNKNNTNADHLILIQITSSYETNSFRPCISF